MAIGCNIVGTRHTNIIPYRYPKFIDNKNNYNNKMIGTYYLVSLINLYN